MDPKQRAALAKVTTGLLAGEAENPAREVAKITDDKTTEIDVMTTEVSIEHLENFAKQDKPFLMSINFGKKHQPNKPANDSEAKLRVFT